jgi:hypothetical protein
MTTPQVERRTTAVVFTQFYRVGKKTVNALLMNPT